MSNTRNFKIETLTTINWVTLGYPVYIVTIIITVEMASARGRARRRPTTCFVRMRAVHSFTPAILLDVQQTFGVVVAPEALSLLLC